MSSRSQQRHVDDLTLYRGSDPERRMSEDRSPVMHPRRELQPHQPYQPTDNDLYQQFLTPPSSGGFLSDLLQGNPLDRQYRDNGRKLRLMRQANEAAELARQRRHGEIMAGFELAYEVEIMKRNLRAKDEAYNMEVANRKYRMAEARGLMWDNRMKRAKVALLYLEVKRAKREQRYLERKSDVEE
jgi:hypothetical protein